MIDMCKQKTGKKNIISEFNPLQAIFLGSLIFILFPAKSLVWTQK